MNEIKELLETSKTTFLAALTSIENNVFGVVHRETLIETTPGVQQNASAEYSRDTMQHVDTELAESEVQSALTAALAPAPTVECTQGRKKDKKTTSD